MNVYCNRITDYKVSQNNYLREQYQADAEADMQDSLKRMMVEDPEQVDAILESARQAGPTLAKQELFIRLKMASGASEAEAKVLWILSKD